MDAYGDLASIAFARTADAALQMLRESPPTILIGTLVFDESRFWSLIPQAKLQGCSVVIVDCPYTRLSEEHLGRLRRTAGLLGIDAWWDMRTVFAAQGAAAAAAQIRAIVQELLAKNSDAR